MAGIRNIVFGLAFSTLTILAPAAEAMPVVATHSGQPVIGNVQSIDYYPRAYRGWNGTGYRPYRPYQYRPYRPYRPYAAPYAYRPYRPYYRPGVQVYVEPRRYYRQPVGGHVQWCLSRYRSYNPQTDTFLSYGGVYKYCRSPYR